MRSERDIYALWERIARTGLSFRCCSGQQVTVLSAGRRNTGPGPDYPGAVLLVDGRLRCGAVEMHLREQDWFAHGHQHDPAYASVILHLLEVCDDSHRLPIPTLDVETLLGAEDMKPSPGEYAHGIAVTPDLLLEMSWQRLLRRTTILLRQTGNAACEDLRRSFVRLLFDALGYSGNRVGMRRVAGGVLEREEQLAGISFEQTAAMVFEIARVDRTEAVAIGASFIPESRLRKIFPEPAPISDADWRAGTRPANAPARRLWGGAKLLYDIYRQNLIPRLAAAMRSGRGIDTAASLLRVRLGSEAVIGSARAMEIALNALLPVLLAVGIRTDDSALIEATCRAYRNAPAQGSNRHLLLFRQRYGLDLSTRGAFWQQGGIELVQRYMSDDRSGLSFVAEGVVADMR